MRKFIAFILFLSFINFSYSQPISHFRPGTKFEEEDGSPSGRYRTIQVFKGNLSEDTDGSATLFHTSRSLLNGSFREAFNATITADATTVTMNLEKSGGGDLTMQFSDGDTDLDTTPAITIALTPGSDTSPTENFIYILKSDKILTKSTSSFPTGIEHNKIGYFLVPSATFVNTANQGVYVNQNWNDFLSDSNNEGHLLHIAERERRTEAQYFSGIDGNGTANYLSPDAGNVELISTSGVIYQMHRHTFGAFDTSTGDLVLVKNWSGDAYHDITNLYDITEDSTGATIGNNKYFNLVIWGVGNKSGGYHPMMINLPGGFYNTQSAAENDVSGYDDFSMPREFNRESSTGFLIARITIQMKTGGGTWVVKSTVDLRGQTPSVARGGAAGVATDFPDNAFTIFDESDPTKILNFDVGSNITTTRTLIAPNLSATIATGPGSANDNRLAIWDGTSGSLLKENFWSVLGGAANTALTYRGTTLGEVAGGPANDDDLRVWANLGGTANSPYILLTGQASLTLFAKTDIIADMGVGKEFRITRGFVDKAVFDASGNLQIDGNFTVSGGTIITPADLLLDPSGGDTLFDSFVWINNAKELRFRDSDNSNYVSFRSPANVGTNIDWILPDADSSGTQALVSDGSKNLGWATPGDVDQNIWLTIDSDSGSVDANSTTDILSIDGGTGISTAINGDTLTITNDSPNADQNLWETFIADTGSTTADSVTDTLTIEGGVGITTTIVGDTFTITNSEPATKEFFVPAQWSPGVSIPAVVEGNVGDHYGWLIAGVSGGIVYMNTFVIPADFTTLVSANVIVFDTTGMSNIGATIDLDWGTLGEALGSHTATATIIGGGGGTSGFIALPFPAFGIGEPQPGDYIGVKITDSSVFGNTSFLVMLAHIRYL